MAKKVAFINSDVFLGQMFEHVFNKNGFDFYVISAVDEHTIQNLKKIAPDIILSQILFQGDKNGYDLVSQIRSDSFFEHTPVIAFTNIGAKKHIKKAYNSGFDDYWIMANHAPSEIFKMVKEKLDPKSSKKCQVYFSKPVSKKQHSNSSTKKMNKSKFLNGFILGAITSLVFGLFGYSAVVNHDYKNVDSSTNPTVSAQETNTNDYQPPNPLPTNDQNLPAPNGTYRNTYGNDVPRPYYSDTKPAGASAKCGDGTYSFSQSRRGTCSHHGGVSTWY